MNSQVTLVVTSYNNRVQVIDFIESCVQQEYKEWQLIIVDDGSTDGTVEAIRMFASKYKNIYYTALPHGERGLARARGMNEAIIDHSAFVLFLDSDMLIEPEMLGAAVEFMHANTEVGALVIPEIPISNYSNFWTKVKLFERSILNAAGNKLGERSIEAARFWRKNAYIESGGLVAKQIAFEEIQPTIRYVEGGGSIMRLTKSGVFHDEKKVTLKTLVGKKKYYFKEMDKTFKSEKNGFIKALKRWYFFRPVLYRKENLKSYLKNPLLFVGMCTMYMLLTVIAVISVIETVFKPMEMRLQK